MLTERQQDTLDYIRNYIQGYGRSPLVSEIAKGLGLRSQGTTHRYIQALVDEGLLERHVGRTRGLVLLESAENHQDERSHAVVLPVMGKIAAGRLVEAVADETEIDLSEMFSGKDRFVLKVNGDSMIDKAIMSGDWVVVQSQSRAQHGEIVVALVDGYDATLKTLLINDDGTVNEALTDDVLISNWIPLDEHGDPTGAQGPLNVANGGKLPINYPPLTSNFEIELNANQLESDFKVFDNYQNGLTLTNNSEDKTLLKGLFIDSPVEGLTYVSGSYTGITNVGGEFQYRYSEFIDFFAGELQLGRFKGQSYITPFSLNSSVTDREKSMNIVRLLQSLDEDAMLENGIDIRNAVESDDDNELSGIDLSVSVNAFGTDLEHQEILGHLTNSSVFVSLQDALNHVSNTMLSLGLGVPELQTTKVSLTAKLDASAIVLNETFDPNNQLSYNHSVSIETFDSLGKPHQLVLYFSKYLPE